MYSHGNTDKKIYKKMLKKIYIGLESITQHHYHHHDLTHFAHFAVNRCGNEEKCQYWLVSFTYVKMPRLRARWRPKHFLYL